jgi:hypothetical protein
MTEMCGLCSSSSEYPLGKFLRSDLRVLDHGCIRLQHHVHRRDWIVPFTFRHAIPRYDCHTKTRFQSFFMLTTYQPLLLACAMRASEKTLMVASVPYSRAASS